MHLRRLEAHAHAEARPVVEVSHRAEHVVILRLLVAPVADLVRPACPLHGRQVFTHQYDQVVVRFAVQRVAPVHSLVQALGLHMLVERSHEGYPDPRLILHGRAFAADSQRVVLARGFVKDHDFGGGGEVLRIHAGHNREVDHPRLPQRWLPRPDTCPEWQSRSGPCHPCRESSGSSSRPCCRTPVLRSTGTFSQRLPARLNWSKLTASNRKCSSDHSATPYCLATP